MVGLSCGDGGSGLAGGSRRGRADRSGGSVGRIGRAGRSGGSVGPATPRAHGGGRWRRAVATLLPSQSRSRAASAPSASSPGSQCSSTTFTSRPERRIWSSTPPDVGAALPERRAEHAEADPVRIGHDVVVLQVQVDRVRGEPLDGPLGPLARADRVRDVDADPDPLRADRVDELGQPRGREAEVVLDGERDAGAPRPPAPRAGSPRRAPPGRCPASAASSASRTSVASSPAAMSR